MGNGCVGSIRDLGQRSEKNSHHWVLGVRDRVWGSLGAMRSPRRWRSWVSAPFGSFAGDAVRAVNSGPLNQVVGQLVNGE